MSVGGGDVIFANDINRLEEREGTTPIAADSAPWGAAETVASSVTIPAVNGQRYKVWFSGKVSTDVAADASNMRLREDGLSGNQLQLGQVYLPTISGNGWIAYLYAEWTAAATASKTFVLTGQRSVGTGVGHRVRGSANAPGYLVAEKVVD